MSRFLTLTLYIFQESRKPQKKKKNCVLFCCGGFHWRSRAVKCKHSDTILRILVCNKQCDLEAAERCSPRKENTRNAGSHQVLLACFLFSAKKPRAAKSTHQLAAPLPAGTVLTDMFKKQWKVGTPVGSGGFGLIYLGERKTMYSCTRGF